MISLTVVVSLTGSDGESMAPIIEQFSIPEEDFARPPVLNQLTAEYILNLPRQVEEKWGLWSRRAPSCCFSTWVAYLATVLPELESSEEEEEPDYLPGYPAESSSEEDTSEEEYVTPPSSPHVPNLNQKSIYLGKRRHE